MPALRSVAHVGKFMLSNGELLAQQDVDAIDMAHRFAKRAVEEHRVSAYEVERWKSEEKEAWHLAKWIGRAVSLACNVEKPSHSRTMKRLEGKRTRRRAIGTSSGSTRKARRRKKGKPPIT